MGEHEVHSLLDEESARAQQHALLEDLDVLGKLLASNQLESGVRMIGAEQEIFLVDRNGRPAPVAMEILEQVKDPRLTTEIARFNLEANLTPRVFTGRCLRELEDELQELLDKVSAAAAPLGAAPVLCGILPSLTESDLAFENMTPNPRYYALSNRMSSLRSEPFHMQLQGDDSLEFEQENILPEGCNTSFQLHYQVDPERFALAYNLAQFLTGPILAASVNSPLLFGRRLWSETRIGLFQQSVDTRSPVMRKRKAPSRVSFGEHWVEHSVLELFREDIERHRVVLAPSQIESSAETVSAGGVPKLSSLRLHNGTVYRWNRPCIGWNEKALHLRIEARAFPAGPSVLDEIANAALFYGALHDALFEIEGVSALPFARIKEGFFAAARSGLDARLPWIDGKHYSARTLLLQKILPMAYRGLHSAGIDFRDAEYYLGVITERVHAGITGASWTLNMWNSMSGLDAQTRSKRLVSMMREQQQKNAPVHTWPQQALAAREKTVGDIMTRDLFTARAADSIEIALSTLRWLNIRHLPIEDNQGHLVGVLTEGALLRALAQKMPLTEPISSIVEPSRITLSASDTLQTAIRFAREQRLSALPVVENNCLVGLLTERDLLYAAESFLSVKSS